MKETILVAGGAGYIGSHAAKALRMAGHVPLVFDNFSTGHRDLVRFGDCVDGDLAMRDALDKVFAEHRIAAVMHFAAFAYVGESVSHPADYYRNNVANTLNLLEAMLAHGVKRLIFSSTCATYGVPEKLPLTEDHAQTPVNPYGRTKLAVEWMLEDFRMAYGLSYASLRYFNAAGADPEGECGERHSPETHLIPLVLKAALHPEDQATGTIKVFGTDYPTPDGTCIRDYIHVTDLAQAHLLALERLLHVPAQQTTDANTGLALAYNLGNGQGYSVRQVIDVARRVTGKAINEAHAPRRPGDPPCLVGNAGKAITDLGWRPRFTDLETIIRTAWEWELKEAGG